jgi:hypothetical protein
LSRAGPTGSARSRRSGFRDFFCDFFYLEQMLNLINHASDSGRIAVGHRMMQTAQAQGDHDPALILGSANTALDPGYLELSHETP